MALKAIFFIWIGYGIPSMFFSIVALYCIWRWKEFDAPFYRLVQCDLIINFIVYLHTWIKRISTDDEISDILIPVLINARFILRINDFFSQAFYHLQSGSLLIKCAYRYSVATKFVATSYWREKYLRIYLVVIFLSMCYTAPYAFASNLETVTYNATTNSLSYIPDRWGRWFWVMDLQCGLYILVTVVIGIITWRRIKNEWNSARAIRKRITVMIIIDALLHILVWLWHFLPAYVDMSKNNRVAMLFYVSDMISCTTPYILMFVDPLFRRTFLRRVFNWNPTPEVEPVQAPQSRAPSVSESRF